MIVLTLSVALIAVRRAKSSVEMPPAQLKLPVDEMFGLPQNYWVADQNGIVVFKGSEIDAIPSGVHHLDIKNEMVQRTGRIVSELFKGTLSIPGKTIEIIFKPEIQAGLSEGTYTLMKTRAGETL
ncbi:MAG: hypothetical protein ACLGI6_17915, partial [Gammaproteobacteria bacterium]